MTDKALIIGIIGQSLKGSGVSSSLAFIKLSDGSFDPEETRLMGDAFDAAKPALGAVGTSPIYDGVTFRIIEAARSGECDLDQLADAGMGWRRCSRRQVV